MSGTIIFFQKNKMDFSYTSVSATASEAPTYASYVLNRNNYTAWITTGSVDANLTTFTVDFGESKTVSDILLLKHNFKSYTVKYWNGAAWTDFSPAISETNYTDDDSYYEVASVQASMLQITINGTQVANSDKYLYQFIATEKIGRLAGWPLITKPVSSRNRRKNQMLSGKYNIYENVGNYSTTLKLKGFTSDADMTIFESIFNYVEGFLVWPCGGNELQFRTLRQGYRLEDIYLMKCSSEYVPEYNKGYYKSGINMDIKLEEVID